MSSTPPTPASSASPASPANSLTTLSDDDRRQLVASLPPDSRAIAAAPARIYHAAFSAPDAWSYTGLHGLLVFGRTRPAGADAHTHWFRLLDTAAGRGVVWLHQIERALDYRADKPFFHVFSGASRTFGLRFDDDAEAEAFHRRVRRRVHTTAPSSPSPPASPLLPATPPPPGRSRKVSRALISAPAAGSFVHVAHVGFDADGRLEASDGIEPALAALVGELRRYGGGPGSGFLADAPLTPVDGCLPVYKGLEKRRGTLRRKKLPA